MVSISRSVVEVMQDHDDRSALICVQLPQEVENFQLMGDVQIGRRIIEQEEWSLLRQRHGNPGALPLATGQPIEFALGTVKKAGGGQRLFDNLFVVPARARQDPFMRMSTETAELSNDQPIRRYRALRQQGKRLCHRSCSHHADWFSIKIDRARGGMNDTRERAQQCRLAAAVCADQGRDFPVRYGEIDIVQHRGGGIADGDFFSVKACRVGISHGDLSP